MSDKIGVTVEICLSHYPNSQFNADDVSRICANYVISKMAYWKECVLQSKEFEEAGMEGIVMVRVCLSEEGLLNGFVWDANALVKYYFYVMNEEEMETMEEENQVTSYIHNLPNKNLDGLWESLVFDSRIKQELLDYSKTSMLFSSKGVNNKIISCNRIILLHGTPGTGKTSLCKALAQKLSIYSQHGLLGSGGILVEVNAHSLFSKWFSESGKLVAKAFDNIRQLASDMAEAGTGFVFVLLDEVESLSATRKADSNEPADAIRVVNALLTQLDRLKDFNNILVLATSNITNAIDSAFLDRVDFSINIPNPSVTAIYKILTDEIYELIRCGIIEESHIDLEMSSDQFKEELTNISECCALKGLSGRSLRKLAFQAHALFCRDVSASLSEFVLAMKAAANRK